MTYAAEFDLSIRARFALSGLGSSADFVPRAALRFALGW
jgi:hypothetical protein